jgi:hypothetical protein
MPNARSTHSIQAKCAIGILPLHYSPNEFRHAEHNLHSATAPMQQISGIQNTRPVRKLTIEGTIDI